MGLINTYNWYDCWLPINSGVAPGYDGETTHAVSFDIRCTVGNGLAGLKIGVRHIFYEGWWGEE